MTETPDPQLQLKKRARRRLVGAVAFAGLAAVILPMVMDEEPRQPVQDVQIRIPGQDQSPFKPKEPDLRAAGSAVVAAATVAAGFEQLGTTAAVSGKASPNVPVVKAAAAPEARPTEKTDNKAAERKVIKPAEKAPEKPAEKKVVKPAEKAPEKTIDKKVTKLAEASPDKAAEKKVVKPVDKAPEKAPDKQVEKVAEKAPVKKVDKPAEKAPEPAAEDAGKAPGDEAPHASPAAPASSKPAETAVKPAGQQGILIGAFANAENAKQVQGKIGSAGVNTYTEILDTPDGKKTRVRAGPFPNREAAEKALEKLKRIGVTGVVAGRQ